MARTMLPQVKQRVRDTAYVLKVKYMLPPANMPFV